MRSREEIIALSLFIFLCASFFSGASGDGTIDRCELVDADGSRWLRACDDFDVCSTDFCSPERGCSHVPVCNPERYGYSVVCILGECYELDQRRPEIARALADRARAEREEINRTRASRTVADDMCRRTVIDAETGEASRWSRSCPVSASRCFYRVCEPAAGCVERPERCPPCDGWDVYQSGPLCDDERGCYCVPMPRALAYVRSLWTVPLALLRSLWAELTSPRELLTDFVAAVMLLLFIVLAAVFELLKLAIPVAAGLLIVKTLRPGWLTWLVSGDQARPASKSD